MAARLEHPGHLGQGLRPIGNVVRRLARVDEMERARSQGELLGVGNEEMGTDTLGSRSVMSSFDLVRIDIDTDDFDPEILGEVDGFGTVSTADIEQQISWTRLEAPDTVHRVAGNPVAVAGAVDEVLLEAPHFHGSLLGDQARRGGRQMTSPRSMSSAVMSRALSGPAPT